LVFSTFLSADIFAPRFLNNRLNPRTAGIGYGEAGQAAFDLGKQYPPFSFWSNFPPLLLILLILLILGNSKTVFFQNNYL
jgi:hypothetical protein